jgi:hypothetical protein
MHRLDLTHPLELIHDHDLIHNLCPLPRRMAQNNMKGQRHAVPISEHLR